MPALASRNQCTLRGACGLLFALTVIVLASACEPPRPAASTLPAGPPAPSFAVRCPASVGLVANAPMSRDLGGMRLGMSFDELARMRESTGPKRFRLRRMGACCTIPPELLQLGDKAAPFDGVIVGAFCGPDASVCELAYVVYGKLTQRDAQIHALLGELRRRYGAPTTMEGHAFDDPAAACAAGRAVHFVRTWSFGPNRAPGQAIGRTRIVFDCEPSEGPRENPLTIVIDDERGLGRPSSVR
ncbi:MAG: hypothetical protein U0235_00605 [Polyangiaceae bacterium]